VNFVPCHSVTADHFINVIKNLCQGNSWRSCTRSGRPRGKATAPISWSTSTDLSTSSHLIWSTSSGQSWSTSTDWSTNSDWSRSTDSSTRYKRNSNNQHMIQARALWLNALHLLLSKICIFHTQYLEYTNWICPRDDITTRYPPAKGKNWKWNWSSTQCRSGHKLNCFTFGYLFVM